MIPENFCNQIDDYLDGFLDPPSQIQFELHLDSCSHCKDEVRLAGELEEVISAAWSTVKAPATVREAARKSATYQGLRSLPPKWMSSDLVQTCLAIATVVLLSCGLGWMVLKLQPAAERALSETVAVENMATEKTAIENGPIENGPIENEDRGAANETATIQDALAKQHDGQRLPERNDGMVKFYAGKNQNTAILLPSKQQSKSFTIVNVFPVSNSSSNSATNFERDNNDTF